MRVIIAGSRSCNDPFLVARAIAESGFQIEQVVCGMARGVDLLGRAWALQHGSRRARDAGSVAAQRWVARYGRRASAQSRHGRLRGRAHPDLGWRQPRQLEHAGSSTGAASENP